MANSGLSPEKYGILLLADRLYRDVPENLDIFRNRFSHLDPSNVEKNREGITFLKIAESDEPTSVIKHRLNSYINMKIHHMEDYRSYEENMVVFKKMSMHVTKILHEILVLGQFPEEIISTLKELPEVRRCHDFYDLLQMYRKARTRRLKFEILRKVGLIVLMARIRRVFAIEEYDFALEKVRYTFTKGLGLMKLPEKKYYMWLDSNSKLVYTSNKEKAEKLHKKDCEIRKSLGHGNYGLQTVNCESFKTRHGIQLLHMTQRNKLRKDGDLYMTSVVEKILRKNLEFPNQVRDILGIKLVVKTDEEIPQLISDLETFLGGSSTRKQEKNYLNKFGRRKLGEYSSKDFFVWKAVYDITLPHPSSPHVEKMMKLAKGNKMLQEALRERLDHFQSRPRDFVVELQLQELSSYLLSVARGSPSDHALLKMKQIRSNTFFKLYPKEIYESCMINMRNRMITEKEI